MAATDPYYKGNTKVFYGGNLMYQSDFTTGVGGWLTGLTINSVPYPVLTYNQTNANIPQSTGWLECNFTGLTHGYMYLPAFPLTQSGVYNFQTQIDYPAFASGTRYLAISSLNPLGLLGPIPILTSGGMSVISLSGAITNVNTNFISLTNTGFVGVTLTGGLYLYLSDSGGSPQIGLTARPFYLKNISIYGPANELLPGMPTPLIDINEEAILVGGNVWGTKKNINLKGQVTINSSQDFFDIQRYLRTALSDNFGNLMIYDNFMQSNNSLSFLEPNIYINSINYPENKYLSIGEYTVNMSSYPPDFFNYYGVLDVKDEWNFEENGDYILNITRTFGARGFNTNNDTYNNAYDNAVNFVINYINNNTNPISGQTVLPQFITNKNLTLGYTPFLVNQVETSNRFNGEYTVTQTFKADLFYNQLGILRYKMDLNEPFAGFQEATIDGEFIGSRDAGFANLRQQFISTDFVNEILTQAPLLNPATLEKNVTEDQLSCKIKFSFKYNSDKQQNTIQDISTSVNALIDIVKVKVDGEIRAKKMSSSAWSGVSGAYSNLNILNLAQQEYALFYTGAGIYPLNPTPEAKTYVENINENTIGFSYTFNNNAPPSNNFEIINIKKNVNVPVRVIKPSIILNNMGYYFTDMGIDTIRQTKIEANGLAIETDNDANAILELSNIMSGYLEYGGQLESNTESNSNQKFYTVSQTYVYPKPASLTNFSGVSL